MDNTRRIDIFIPTLEIGGAERAASSLFQNIKKRYKSTRLIATDDHKSSLIEKDFVQLPKGKFPRKLDRIFNIRKIVESNNTDVVIVFLSHTSILVFLSLLFLKVKIVACERSDPFNSSRGFFYQIISRITYRSVDRVVVQTNRLKSKLESVWGLDNLIVIPNASVDTGEYEHKINETVKIIVTICRLMESKNCGLLISSVKNLLMEGRQLIIYGDGPEKANLKTLVTSLDLDNYVTIISDISNIKEMLTNTDIFVTLSSLEGFPNALLEAVSLGIPSAAYNCEFGPSEILDKGNAGKLLNSLNPDYIESNIRELCADHSKRLHYSENGIKFSKRSFNMDIVMSKWNSAIESL